MLDETLGGPAKGSGSKVKSADPNEVKLLLDGSELSGWQEIRISRGIERMPSDFDFLVTEYYPRNSTFLARPGSECEVRIGKDLVLTGYVDRHEANLSKRSHNVRLTGRGKCQDLVDCSAYLHDKHNQINRASGRKVIETICEVYGIKVQAPDGDGKIVPQFNVNLLETAWGIIDRIAAHSQFLAYESATGDLILSEVGKARMASGFRQGINVESARLTHAFDRRYSRYEAIYTPIENLADLSGALGKTFLNERGHANDDKIGADKPGTGQRFRPLIMMAEVAQDGSNPAEIRCKWERARRIGRSQELHVTVDSWRDAAGRLWEPNTVAPIHIPSLRLPDAEWVISEVTYEKGQDGTRAHLVLMPPGAFLPEPVLLQAFDAQIADELQRERILREGGAFRESGDGPGV
jgi:prophage tail gpP-like protein